MYRKKVSILILKKVLTKKILLSVPTQNIKKVHNYTNGDQNMKINIQFFVQYKYSLFSFVYIGFLPMKDVLGGC